MRWTERFADENVSENVSESPSETRTRSTIGPSDLTFHKELGVGMSGVVYLAKVKGTNATCCVKVMRKKKLLKLDQAENIARERRLSRAFAEDTSFIMQSLCAFQDTHCLYLVMDFMPGGDLFQMLVHGTGARGAFAPAAARFYASEVFLALEFLHRREFVYRDLKPENVLVDVGGHVKLADLGFCKRVAPGERTYTTCGTSDYMAPEVMLSQGYDQSADLWAFGVFVFELLAGHAPFKAETDARRHRRILTADLRSRRTSTCTPRTWWQSCASWSRRCGSDARREAWTTSRTTCSGTPTGARWRRARARAARAPGDARRRETVPAGAHAGRGRAQAGRGAHGRGKRRVQGLLLDVRARESCTTRTS